MDRYAVFETAHGFAAIAWAGETVTGFRLPAGTPAQAERAILRRRPAAEPGPPSAAVDRTIADARRYFAGEPADFADVAVDLDAAPPLHRRVYDRVRRLGRGETTTYGAVAQALGLGPEAARDVGEAMARNPVPLIVPCHRVLAAGGRIGGFSAPGGSQAKARMLALEGVEPAPPPPTRASASSDPQLGFGF